MKTLYTVQVEVKSDKPEETYGLVVRMIKEWVENWYKDKRGFELDLSKEKPELNISGHEITTKIKCTTENSSAASWELIWKYAEIEKAKTLNVVVSRYLQQIETVLSIGIQAGIPENPIVIPPDLVSSLIKAFECYVNGYKLSSSPHVLQKNDVASFYSEVLASKKRTLPVVVISPTSTIKKYHIEPDKVALDLAGVAEVFVLDNQDVALDLIDKIGNRDLSCYNGIVRVYRPHFSREANSREHPYYHPRRVRNIHEQVIQECASLSVIRFNVGEITRQAENAINNDQRERLSAAITNSQDRDEINKIATQLLDRNTELEEENKELKRQYDIAQRNLLEILQKRSTSEIEQEDNNDLEIDSVFDAVAKAKKRFGETLFFHKKAYKSAKESDFEKPKRVYEAFKAMDKICRERRNAQNKRESVGRIQTHFEDEGFRYSPNISETTSEKYRDEYTIDYKGTSILIDEHIEFGNDRDAKHCLRIHFAWHKDEQKFIIGHVGKHKTNTLT